MKYSVIDISSSSISMVAAEVTERVTEIVFKDRASLTLLHYLDGHNLSPRGIEKLTEAVALMKDKCASLDVDVLYLIATAALRAVGNFEEVRTVILRETGLPVNLIEAKTEAYCDLIANRFFDTYERAVLLDIGGASIEICDLAGDGPDDMYCLDFGILNLRNKFVEKIQPDENEAKKIKKYISRKFDKAQIPEQDRFSTVVMVGATGLALYDLYAEYTGAKQTDGPRQMEYKKFKKLAKHLLSGSARSKLILDVAPEKLYAVGIAAVIAKTVFKRFGADNIVVSDRGVKEGYLHLIIEGKQSGAFYDFAKGGSFEPVAAKAEEAKSENAEQGKGNASEKKKVNATGMPAKKKQTASAEKAAEGTAASAAKRRGRPKKSEAAQAAEAKPAVKRRGRPKKTAEKA